MKTKQTTSSNKFKFLSRNSLVSKNDQILLFDFVSKKIKEDSNNNTEILLLLRVLTQSKTASSNEIKSIFSKKCHELSLNYCLKHDLPQFFIMLTKLIFEIYPNFKDDENEEKLNSLYILYHCCIIKSNEFSVFLKLKLKNFESKSIQHAIKIYELIQLQNPIEFFKLYEKSNENEKILMENYLNFIRIQIFNNVSFSYLEIDFEFLLKILNFKNKKEIKIWIEKEMKNQKLKKMKDISQIQNDKIIFRIIKKK